MKSFSQKFSGFKRRNNFLKTVIKLFMNEIFASLSFTISQSWICSSSCPLSQWCHPTLSSPVAPFTSCPQSFPESGSLPMSQIFASGGQSIRASASGASVNIHGWFSLGLTGLIALLSKGLSRVFSSTTVRKPHPIKQRQLIFMANDL